MANIDSTLSTKTRLYVKTAFGEPIISKLKELGAHWDVDARAWWITTKKTSAIEALLGTDQVRKEEFKAKIQDFVPITGDTYPVREEIKGLGGVWDKLVKVWKVPADQAEKARKIVAGQSAVTPTVSTPKKRFSGEFAVGTLEGVSFTYKDDAYKPDQRYFEAKYLGTLIKRNQDGLFYSVIGVKAFFISQDMADDNDIIGTDGGFSAHWAITVYCRLATEEEAAPESARRAANAKIQKLNVLCDGKGQFVNLPDHSGDLQPEIEAQITERILIWEKTVGYSVNQTWRTNLGLLSFRPVYDDSPVWKLLRWDNMTPEEIELVKNAATI